MEDEGVSRCQVEPLLGKDDVGRQVHVIPGRVGVVLGGLPDNVGSEGAITPLEGQVRVVEMRPHGPGQEGVAEPETVPRG